MCYVKVSALVSVLVLLGWLFHLHHMVGEDSPVCPPQGIFAIDGIFSLLCQTCFWYLFWKLTFTLPRFCAHIRAQLRIKFNGFLLWLGVAMAQAAQAQEAEQEQLRRVVEAEQEQLRRVVEAEQEQRRVFRNDIANNLRGI